MKDKTISEILDELKELVNKYEEEIEMAYDESDPLTAFLDGIEPTSYTMWRSNTIIDNPQKHTIYIKEYVWLDGRWVWL